MRPQKLFIVIAVLSFIFLSAAECDDQCSKCQDAIDHMYEKIETQFCNPNTMQKAWDGIREECDHFDSAVGLMAETCSLGNTARPGCNNPGIDMKSNNVVIEINSLASDGLTYNINVSVRDHTSIFVYDEDSEFVQVDYFSPENFSIFEGDIVEVVVEVINENGVAEEFARKSETFTFARNGRWSQGRGIDVRLDTEFEDIIITFLRW